MYDKFFLGFEEYIKLSKFFFYIFGIDRVLYIFCNIYLDFCYWLLDDKW